MMVRVLTYLTALVVLMALPTSGQFQEPRQNAPVQAQYWVGAANGTLTAEKNLGALSTGLVLNTSGTPSAYAGTSCTNQFPRSLSASGAGTCATVSLTADVTGTLQVANGGTNTTSWTVGSVVFAGASGTALTQDNANLFWDDTDNQLRIGPSHTATGGQLDVVSGTSTANAIEFVAAFGAAFGIDFRANKARGTPASPTIVTTGDDLLAITARGYDGTNYRDSSQIVFSTTGTVNGTQVPGRILFKTATGGSTTTRFAIEDAYAAAFGNIAANIAAMTEDGTAAVFTIGGTGDTGGILELATSKTLANNDFLGSVAFSAADNTLGGGGLDKRLALINAQVKGSTANDRGADLIFQTKPDGGGAGLSERLRIDSGGTLILGTGQLAFPATQTPSSGVNTLDDYEESTFTPIIGGVGGQTGQTYDIQIGRYVKIGRFVYVYGQVRFTAKGTITGAVMLGGLPFTVEAGHIGQVPVHWVSLATTWVSIDANPSPSSTFATLAGAQTAATNNDTGLATADLNDTSRFDFAFSYRATE